MIEEQIERHGPEDKSRRTGIAFRFRAKDFLLAGLFIGVLGFLLGTNPDLILTADSEEGFPSNLRNLIVLGAMLVIYLPLCFVEITLPPAVKQILGWVMIFVLPLLTFLAVDTINNTNIDSFSFATSFANYIIYVMVFSLLYGLIRRVWVTALVGGGAFLFYGIANYFTAAFRGAPILPWDLQTVGTALAVMGNYDYTITGPMAVSLCGLLVTVLLCFRLCPVGKSRLTRRYRLAERASALMIAGVLGILIFPADVLSDLGISVWAWNQKTSSRLTGITAGFCANIQFIMVDKPEGYSQEQIEEIAEEIQGLEEPESLGSPSQAPTIIAVMNESMTDLQSTSNGAVTFTPDNMPFIHALEESGTVIWGTAYSSVYGGNTCNSEYEFLTGNTTAFLPNGSKPYQQYVNSAQTSLVSTLEDYGYASLAIHPGQRGAWQRNTAYAHLGFDSFIDASLFDVNRTFEHGMTSDASNYNQVIYSYEHRDKSKPLFIHNVTIQNHGGFTDENYPTTVQVNGLEGEYPETEQYLSLTKKSDEAFQKLLDYFSAQEEPVVILFFGDHWPNLETGFLTELLGTDATALDMEGILREHEVPFLLWANYPMEGEHMEKISLNYLSGLLLRAADLPLTEYQKYLVHVQETFPVITANGLCDKDGIWYKVGEETPYDELLNRYASLQYNNAFGDEEKKMELFTVESLAKKAA